MPLKNATKSPAKQQKAPSTLTSTSILPTLKATRLAPPLAAPTGPPPQKKRKHATAKRSKAAEKANLQHVDNRRLDLDGFPHSKAPVFIGGWATRSTRKIDDKE